MPNIPGSSFNIYGTPNHYFRYKDTTLFVGWNGGIELTQGNWLDAAIALRIRIKSHTSDTNIIFGHIHINKQLELSLQMPADIRGNDLFIVAARKLNSPQIISSIQNFPVLKEHYDKIKNLSVFW